MTLIDSISMFFKGIKSSIDTSGVIQNMVSDSLSNGIETGFNKIKKPIEQTIIKIASIVISMFLMIWGIAMFIDNFVPYHGLGYMIVGVIFGLITLAYFRFD